MEQQFPSLMLEDKKLEWDHQQKQEQEQDGVKIDEVSFNLFILSRLKITDKI